MNLIELNNRIQYLEQVIYKRIDGRTELYRKADNELFYSGQKAINANLKYISRLVEVDTSKYKEEIQQIIVSARSLPSYSLANVFVWVKRFLRLERKYGSLHYEFINDFNQWQKQLENLMEILCELPKSKANARLLDKVATLQATLFAEEYGVEAPGQIKALEGMSWLDLLLNDKFAMTKQEVLQLLTIDHDHLFTYESIREIPDVLDYRSFEELVFIGKVEADDDCVFFNLYMERMMKALDENKELNQKTNEVVTEIFGPIQTYTAHEDEYGNVVKLERNKPDLKLVKGGSNK